MNRAEVISEIIKLIGDKEHIFDTTIELTGKFGLRYQTTSITSEGVFIVDLAIANNTDLVLFDNIIHKEDLDNILETLLEELSN